MKMLIFDFRDSEREFFEKNDFTDFELTFIKEPLNSMTQLTEEQWKETDVISTFINSSVTADIINKFKNLRIITTRSTGYDHIDLKCCINNNIAVFNVDQYGQKAVAEYTLGMMIALVRNIMPAYLDVQKNIINHPDYEGRNLCSMTLGVIGCGAIGEAVAKLALSFGMKVLVTSYARCNDVDALVEYVSLEDLLKKSDIISLHIPYTKETHHFLGEKEFKQMKDGVYIINTARGELIDGIVLYENLISGKVYGAALDVLECEQVSLTGDISNIKHSDTACVASALITQKLLALKNVIITPHIAYNTKEAVEALLETTFNNIRDFVKGEHSKRLC
ncbi:MAG: lactate dehydrogenase [Cyanobacteria bacterium SIG31]|nr:lactate dehydrogenase [Cyanobacteria bacterium SIG31]